MRRRLSPAAMIVWAVTAAAARHVTDPVRFAANELALRRVTRRYTVRGSGRQVLIRHPLLDAYVLHEVLGGSTYDLPSDVRTALAGRQVKIVDLGAHVGMATLAMLGQLPDAEVIAIEAHPDSARLLKANISLNGLDDQVTAVAVAAGVSDGVMVMEGHSGLAHAARDDRELTDDIPFLHRAAPDAKAVSVPVIDVLPLIADADLLKIDIEGSEWPILADSRFKTLSARAVVLEYHPQGAPGPDPAEAAAGLLRGAGFTVGEPFDVRGDAGVIWAWKPSL
jgi:FkbM family methyltransferase